MREHAFPPGGEELLAAAVLHHLLVRRPAGDRPAAIASTLLGPAAGGRGRLHLVRSLAGLRRDGLVELRAGRVVPSRAARRFHAIMRAGGPP